MGRRSAPRAPKPSGQSNSLTRPVILDSDDETIIDVSLSPAPKTAGPAATFKGILIPTKRSSSSGQAQSKRNSGSSLSSSLSMSPMTDQQSPYETPDSSLAVTPAESVVDEPFSVLRGRGKRKRTSGLGEEDSNPSKSFASDESLARKLQQEEWNDLDEQSSFTSRTARSTSSISVADDSDESDDAPILKKRRKASSIATSRKPAAGKAFRSSTLKSGNTAQARALNRLVPDVFSLASSDDDSELSSFDSDDLELLDSELESDSAESEPLVTLNTDSTAGRHLQRVRRDAGRSRRRHRRSSLRRVYLNRAERERDRLEKAHPEIKTLWSELAGVPLIETKAESQPESISRKLKIFQLEGLNWMKKQEQTQWKGGLLGDEMGMGKTIQAVALIMSDYPASDPTLVVVPPVALMQWTNEIRDYTDGKLKVLVYHGTNSKAKGLTVQQLKKFNVILISYSSLESIHRKEVKGWTRGNKLVKEDSAMHEITFHRLILDEAHSIKSRTTGVAKACFALKGKYKWCLSGTPVQNRIGEFFSLLRFLEVQPFANYFCKSCSCSELHWSVTADYRCTHCNHRALDHVSVFNQEILNPIIQSNDEDDRKEALRKLRLLTDRIMLRRMKRDHTASMELPPKAVIIHNEFFGEMERDFSSSIMSNTTRQFDTYVSRGVMLNNYANIFGLIMQMRQVADHPDLILKKHGEAGQNVLVCNICDEPCEDAIRSACKHEFCRSCAKECISSADANDGVPDCPRCHMPLAIDLEQPEIEQDEEVVKKSSIINRIKMENWTSSTKIEMLVYDLYKLRSKKQTSKSIVFSQFTSMLQLIEWRLRRAGFNTVMLDGSMTPMQRQRSIEHFMTNPDVEVFLVSLKAGGVALNLTEASRVFIVDPWWNPAAEWQSADRCHRIGQRRPCVITRLCIEDSVESRIVMLQEKKAMMIQGTVNGDDVAMEKLTPEDMQFLFRGT